MVRGKRAIGFMLTETDSGTKAKLEKDLKKLSSELPADYYQAITLYWYKVRDDAKAICFGGAYDTGTLHDSIRIDWTGPFGEKYEVVFRWGGDIEITGMIVAGEGAYINPKTGRICDYAQAVHDGVPSRGRVGIPFLTLAMAMNDGYLQAIMQKFTDKALSKFEKGY